MKDANYPDLETAVAALIEHARQNDSATTWEWAVAVFYDDGPERVRPIFMHLGEGDRDGELIWSVNRTALVLGARAAAWVTTRPDEAQVSIERRGAPTLEVHDLRSGTVRAVRQPFEIVPGGTPGEGWGWRETEGLFQDIPDLTLEERVEAARARHERATKWILKLSKRDSASRISATIKRPLRTGRTTRRKARKFDR